MHYPGSMSNTPPPSNPGLDLESEILYQIYPQSFADSNGDGIGDLAGITSKLDYLADLGITMIWLNPIFDSPFKDAGYDVRDYYQIAPRYGTTEDLVTLVEQAHRHGIKVLLDLVPGHTSEVRNRTNSPTATFGPNTPSIMGRVCHSSEVSTIGMAPTF